MALKDFKVLKDLKVIKDSLKKRAQQHTAQSFDEGEDVAVELEILSAEIISAVRVAKS